VPLREELRGIGERIAAHFVSGGEPPFILYQYLPDITVAVFRFVTALQLSVPHDSSGAVTYRHFLSAGPVQAASAARRVL
jgi:hypothetical protein